MAVDASGTWRLRLRGDRYRRRGERWNTDRGKGVMDDSYVGVVEERRAIARRRGIPMMKLGV